ncbi:MAG: 5-(carboxyamino)imidazole ribonucleotide synthase [Pseudomonadota bacterium]
MAEALPPGSVIGILGGGQLGRMLAIAAARLGLKTHIYEPGAAPPAGDVAAAVTTAPYEDQAALTAFAQSVDVVTYEFENVPAQALDLIEAIVPIRPNRQALSVSQDRVAEKTYLEEIGIRVAPWVQVDSRDDLARAVASLGTPAILKTRRFGYDGKGQARLRSDQDINTAFDALKGAPAVLEAMIPFDREVSVIVARSLDGAVICYDPGENVHRDGILHTTTVPATLPASQRQDAVLMAGKIVSSLDYVGVMGVEMFVTRDAILVNEIAPRVHNSGHWTIEACVIDQFQQHIRAVAGWPLGDGARHSDAVMTNLIGDEAGDWATLATDGGLHLYGKAESRPGRKMGHVTRIAALDGS